MAFMKWEDKYLIQIHIIDKQHQRLFEMIDTFYDLLRARETKRAMSEILQGLATYAEYHFHSEESMMELHHYPRLREHQRTHHKFNETVAEFRARFERGQLLLPLEVADFLKDWLSQHILVTDKEYAPFLLAKGVK